MDSIPTEILQLIFTYACTEYSLDPDIPLPQLNIMLVNSTWHGAALRAPAIWDTLVTSEPLVHHEDASNIRAFQRLTKVLEVYPEGPLNIVWQMPSLVQVPIHGTLPIANKLVTHLLTTSPRWKTLDITANPLQFPMLKPIAGRLDELQDLTVKICATPAIMTKCTVFSNAPQLRSVSCTYSDTNAEIEFPWEQLTHFSASILDNSPFPVNFSSYLSARISSSKSLSHLAVKAINSSEGVRAGVVPSRDPAVAHNTTVQHLSLDELEYLPAKLTLPSLTSLSLKVLSKVYLVTPLITRSHCNITSLYLPQLLPAEHAKLQDLSEHLHGLKDLHIHYNSGVKEMLHKLGRTDIALSTLFVLLSFAPPEKAVFPLLETLEIRMSEERYVTTEWIAGNYPISANTLRLLKMMVTSRRPHLHGIGAKGINRVSFTPICDEGELLLPPLLEFMSSDSWCQLEGETMSQLSVDITIEQRYKHRPPGSRGVLGFKTPSSIFRVVLGRSKDVTAV